MKTLKSMATVAVIDFLDNARYGRRSLSRYGL